MHNIASFRHKVFLQIANYMQLLKGSVGIFSLPGLKARLEKKAKYDYAYEGTTFELQVTAILPLPTSTCKPCDSYA